MSMNQEPTSQQANGSSADRSDSDSWLHGLVDQTLAGIYIIQDGYFRYVNQGFADIFGYASSSDLIDKVKIDQLIAPEDRQKVADRKSTRLNSSHANISYA